MIPVSAEGASTVLHVTGPVACQLWTGEELTGLYPALLSYSQLVDSEEGDFIDSGGIPAGECNSLHWRAPNLSSHRQPG